MVIMIEHSFFRQNDDELIVIPCTIDNSPIALALDTKLSPKIGMILPPNRNWATDCSYLTLAW